MSGRRAHRRHGSSPLGAVSRTAAALRASGEAPVMQAWRLTQSTGRRHYAHRTKRDGEWGPWEITAA